MASTGYDAPNNFVNIRCGAAVRKGQIVKISSGAVIPCSVSGEAFFGVAADGGDTGDLIGVIVGGECDVEVADTTAVGGFVKTDANGRAIALGATGTALGMLLEPGKAVVSGQAAYARVVVRLHDRTLS